MPLRSYVLYTIFIVQMLFIPRNSLGVPIRIYTQAPFRARKVFQQLRTSKDAVKHEHLSNIVFALWSNLYMGSCPVQPAYAAGEWCVQLTPAFARVVPHHQLTI